MYALYELPAGYALFKVLDTETGKVKLQAFQRFKDAKAALEAATSIMEGKMGGGLKKFLKKTVLDKSIQDELAVQDPKIGSAIKKDLGIPCIHGENVLEIFRAIGHKLHELVEQLNEETRGQAALALAHNIARYKLKFSPDKIDLMIIQAVALMEDLDKELNTYMMRVKEWYGWHFPEMQKIVKDNVAYAKVVVKMGRRDGAEKTDFSDILDEDTTKTLREVAAVSMGADIADEDIEHVTSLARESVEMQDYREQLGEYLRLRMGAIAPNLTVMVGELVGARLVQKAGSLIQLAKHPASTVQLLGAEKALFKALKNRQETPKYGLIYNANLITQTPKEHKGKIARVLAAKTSLAARIDSFTESEVPSNESGTQFRDLVERRIHQLDSSVGAGLRTKTMKDAGKKGKRPSKDEAEDGGAAAPMTFVEKKEKKKKREEAAEEAAAAGEPQAKKRRKEKKEKGGE
eukprot:TRINITY_DN7588_c0_g1_i1.p1 TRINITY_DN7588_c0_g1~~TRINITY_DN7588_c0_g1_i1.p1  ORF type:complete len:496 (+),score=240.24 TRINITY_DN7588_c0_g1_i1:104-1489(+)